MNREELQKLIQGAICTLPAPFDQEYEVDYGRMDELCQWLVDEGVKTGNCVLKMAAAGGEGPQLTDAEWPPLLRTVVRAADGKVPVMCGISHKDTYRSIQDAKRAQDLGAIGVQISPPIFNQPNQEDMLRHFEAISDAIDIGVMIYNTPWMTHTMAKRYGGAHVSRGNIYPDTFVRMADFEHIVAVKWAVPDDVEWEEMTKFAHIFNVIDNNTDLIRCHKLGGRGYINSFIDLYPSHDLKIWDLLENKQYDKARKLYESTKTPIAAAVSAKISARSGGMTRMRKGMLAIMGHPVGPPRPPTLPLDMEEMDEVRRVIKSWGWPTVN
ncbi:dihydrodipicolinate synthase family protein [Dehalococcoidia bacterium]|nr:dihydrodipicolinate synthase family protein [Dehalococcoidia bacterium]